MFGNGLNWFENRPTLGWTGFDVDMLEALRISGGFTYTIYSLGGPADIASNGGTYTEAAERALDSAQGNVDVIGQGTWRVNSDRCVCLYLSLVWVHGWLALWHCASARVHVYNYLVRVVWCLASVLYRMALGFVHSAV